MISIIIPVYNVEQYLAQCLDSIISQTYTDFEVILVDDGSFDSSPEICDTYVKTDSRVKVIHQKNTGVSAARNIGISVASGEWIAFIDSDDFVEPDYIEYLFYLLSKYQADISIGGSRYIFEGNDPKSKAADSEEDELLTVSEALRRINYNQGCGATAWVKLFTKELILEHPFPEGQIFEDLAMIYRIVGDSTSIAFGNRTVYYWVQHVGSTTRMEFDERQMAAMDAAESQVGYMAAHYPDALMSAKYRYVAKAIELIANCFDSGGDRVVFERLRKLAGRYSGEVLKDKHAKPTMKARIAAVRMGYIPSRIIFGIHERAKRRILS
jgi:glycosyltransferase involved in cell wall biosynthesis